MTDDQPDDEMRERALLITKLAAAVPDGIEGGVLATSEGWPLAAMWAESGEDEDTGEVFYKIVVVVGDWTTNVETRNA